MSLVEAIDANRAELIELMIRATLPEGASESDSGEVRQFIVGYFTILRAAAAEDFGPRDEYVNTVIPALREANMSLVLLIGGLVRLATVAAAVLGVEHAAWLCDFQSDYAGRILAAWGAE